MAPLRKNSRHDDRDELSDSGPVTLRSARFEVAAPLPLPVEVVAPSGGRSSDESSGVRVVERQMVLEALGADADIVLASDAFYVDAGPTSTEPLFDEDVVFLDDEDEVEHEPDTVRMLPLDQAGVVLPHDTEPPPPTLRSSQLR